MPTPLRYATAVFLALHGLVHWIGFAVPRKVKTTERYTYTTAAAWGNLEPCDGGMRLVGVGMLVAIVPFILAAYGMWRHTSWAIPMTGFAAILSLVFCVLASPAAIAGVAIDVVLVAVAAAAMVAPPGLRGRLS